jgi:hypothetical protein
MHIIIASILFSLLAAPCLRLFSVAHKTRRAPEFWGGLYFLGVSLGVPLRALGQESSKAMPTSATC